MLWRMVWRGSFWGLARDKWLYRGSVAENILIDSELRNSYRNNIQFIKLFAHKIISVSAQLDQGQLHGEIRAGLSEKFI